MTTANGNPSFAPGTLLVRTGTELPDFVKLENDPTQSGWSVVANNPGVFPLERELSKAGWNFFYLAGGIRTKGFGFDKAQMAGAALKRLSATAGFQHCNCIEIDGLSPGSYFGVPYMRLSAHSRRIQKGSLFNTAAEA